MLIPSTKQSFSLNLNSAKAINPIYNPKQGGKVIFFHSQKYLLKRSDQKHINNLCFEVIVCLDINFIVPNRAVKS